MAGAAAGLRSTSYARGPSLELASIMTADVGLVVLRHLASTQERVRICRSISKECRELVDAQVHSLRANLATLSQHDGDGQRTGLPLAFPRLRSLSFERPSAADSSQLLAHLAAHQPQLLAKVQDLDLSTCQGLEADALAAVLQACQSLRSLTLPCLAGCVMSSRLSFAHVLSAHGAGLQHLLGAGDYADIDTLPLLATLPGLRTLDLTPGKHTIRLSALALRPLAALRQLRTLRLGNHLALQDVCELAAGLPALATLAFAYVDEHPGSIQNLAPLQRSASLRTLGLAGLPCGDELLSLLAGIPGLQELSLYACAFEGSPKGAATLAGRLRELSLRVTDRDAAAVAAALPRLGAGVERLALSVHKAAQDYGPLLRAAFGLPALRQLSLESHYHALTDAELAELPVAPQLTSLALCNHFTDATLCAALRAAPGLRALQLSSCGDVSDTGLGCVLGHCRGLRSARLVLMRGASAAGVAALASGPVMSKLVLEGCRNVSAEECRDLMRMLNRPELDIIRLR